MRTDSVDAHSSVLAGVYGGTIVDVCFAVCACVSCPRADARVGVSIDLACSSVLAWVGVADVYCAGGSRVSRRAVALVAGREVLAAASV